MGCGELSQVNWFTNKRYTLQVWLGKPCSLFTKCVPWVRQLCSHLLYTLIQRVAQAKRYALPNPLPHVNQSSALSAWWLTTRLRLVFPLSVTTLELRSLLDVQCSVSPSHLAYPKPNTRFGSTPWQQPIPCHALLYLVCGQPGASAHRGGDWTTVQQVHYWSLFVHDIAKINLPPIFRDKLLHRVIYCLKVCPPPKGNTAMALEELLWKRLDQR